MTSHILPAIRLTLVCIVLFCGIYTAIIWAAAQASPNAGRGIIITHQGRHFHANVGQGFAQDKYFASRPSAVDYNAAGSGGSNKAASNPEYLAELQARIDTFLVHNPAVKKNEIPAELITASGSGIDPHLSVAAAMVQVKRIAKIRRLSEDTLHQLIAKHTQAPLWGVVGTATVNVLRLNIALDALR